MEHGVGCSGDVSNVWVWYIVFVVVVVVVVVLGMLIEDLAILKNQHHICTSIIHLNKSLVCSISGTWCWMFGWCVKCMSVVHSVYYRYCCCRCCFGYVDRRPSYTWKTNTIYVPWSYTWIRASYVQQMEHCVGCSGDVSNVCVVYSVCCCCFGYVDLRLFNTQAAWIA